MGSRTEIVTTFDRLAEIAPGWEALWLRGGQSVFQSFGWIHAWWRSRQGDRSSRLRVGLFWVDDGLVAVMPFVVRWHRGLRVLEWAAKDCSDYCDGLLDPEFDGGCGALEAIWAAVMRAGGFDVAYLSHVRPDSSLRGMLDGRQGARLAPGSQGARSLQVRNDRADGQSWFRGLSKKARNNHTRGLRIISEAGPVTITVTEPGDVVDAWLDRMIELKQRWLVDTGRTNQILGNGAATLRALVDELVRQRALRVFGIECGGRLVAASLNIVSRAGMQAFFAAFEPRFDRASPGTLVMVEYIMWAFDRGIPEVDFLCGDEDYKFKFANRQIDLGSYVGARTLRGQAALAIRTWMDGRRRVGPRRKIVEVAALQTDLAGRHCQVVATEPSEVGGGKDHGTAVAP